MFYNDALTFSVKLKEKKNLSYTWTDLVLGTVQCVLQIEVVSDSGKNSNFAVYA